MIVLARLPVVDGDDDDLSPRRQLVAREVVARAVRELAAVDVEHHRQQLRLSGLSMLGFIQLELVDHAYEMGTFFLPLWWACRR